MCDCVLCAVWVREGGGVNMISVYTSRGNTDDAKRSHFLPTYTEEKEVN